MSAAQGTESDEEVAKRIKTAETEMAFLASAEGQDLMDVVITNDDLETAYAEFKSAIVKVLFPLFCPSFRGRSAAVTTRRCACAGPRALSSQALEGRAAGGEQRARSFYLVSGTRLGHTCRQSGSII